jgi:hypothetical protein
MNVNPEIVPQVALFGALVLLALACVAAERFLMR